MRQKLLMRNTATSLLYQFCNIVCAFILPRCILLYYGSQVNGLVTSVTQFLEVITFLDLGVGAVLQSALYKPLADRDAKGIGQIIHSGDRFFRRIAAILFVYVLALTVLYPFLAKRSDFTPMYTAWLVLIIGVAAFAQHYFGIVDSLLLYADQHGYVQYSVKICTLLANTAVCVMLMRRGYGIHAVKITTSVIFLVRPIIYKIYVRRHYKFRRREPYVEEPIRQKWNGIAQHIAGVVLENTDSIILTLFATFEDVSIYDVYHLVVYGIKSVFVAMTNGMQALLGNLWAKQETETLGNTFAWVEWVLHTAAVVIFGCTGMLLLPFVRIYTADITDAQYIQPLFSVLIVSAQFVHSIRLPYHMMIKAGGHYKQTQNNYIIAAVLNIVLSVVTVRIWGLVGVAIGTLAAMLYQTVWMAWYCCKKLLHISMKGFIRLFITDLCTAAVCVAVTCHIPVHADNYFALALYGALFAAIWAAVAAVINLLFCRGQARQLIRFIRSKETGKEDISDAKSISGE